MRLRQIILAGSAAIAIAGSCPAWADQTFTGLVTVVDRTTGEILVKRDEGGTVGSNAAAPEKFKMRDGIPESLHAGEKVTISYTESGGVKTAIKVDETKN